ncbi:MAG TPA: trypsin-like peptidase domain-containing protein [Pirellulaceae bacterium]|nr:trypsin-like peptidase domain-containing protein [Pirellulaceae bacterium]
MPIIADDRNDRGKPIARSSRTRALRTALPWALTAALGLTVAATALTTGERGFGFFSANAQRPASPGRTVEVPDAATAGEEAGPAPAEATDPPQVEPTEHEPPPTGPVEAETTALATPASAVGASSADETFADVESWLDATVSLETGPAERRERLGAGLIVSDEGDVLTSLHVVRGLRSVTALVRDGAPYEAIGYSAIDEARDLAVLRLDRPPVGAAVFPIDLLADPSRLEPVVALGHPEGAGFAAFEGTVSNLLRPRELPPRSRRFVEQSLRSAGDVLWIQHTAKLLPGCSGGPLLSRSGELLGINSWTDEESGLGYAIASRHVEAIVEQAKSQTAVEALAEVAARNVDWRDLERDLSAANVDRTLTAAEAFDWRPQSEDDYRTLRELAALVTFANQTSHSLRTQSGLEESVVQSLRTASDRAETTLRDLTWDPLVQLALVNEGAERTLDEPQGGCFLFVTAVESFTGRDGSSGFLGELTGGERRVFLRTDSLLERPEPGSHWLVLAIRQQKESVRFGANPLDPEVVPQLRVGALIPLALRGSADL